MKSDYAIHSAFLIHWTGKDIDNDYDKYWYKSDKSKTERCTEAYIDRLINILKYGFWMTEEEKIDLSFNGYKVAIPTIPQTCFTELKLSESRKHARQYGRLGIGVKRPFVFKRLGRPLVYYGFHEMRRDDKFLEACAKELISADLLNFFKPMNSSAKLNYDYYSESEWRIIYFKELLSRKLIIDPRDQTNIEEYQYFMSLTTAQQSKLKYLIPLDGWFAMIIYPSLSVKNKAQQDISNYIQQQINIIKSRKDHGNRVEGRNRPIEVDLDACRNF